MSRRQALEDGVLIAGTAWVASVLQPITLSQASADTTSGLPGSGTRSGGVDSVHDSGDLQLPGWDESLESQSELLSGTEQAAPWGSPGADESGDWWTRATDGADGADGPSVSATSGADAPNV